MVDDSYNKPRKMHGDRAHFTSSHLCSLIGCVLSSLAVFTLVTFVRSTDIHYWNNTVSWIICILVLIIVWCGCCTPSWDCIRGGASTTKSRLFAFALFSCTLAWVAGFLYGDDTFNSYFAPYYDIDNLNTYPSVDPSKYRGAQLMDAGQIDFVPGSRLDLQKSFGFKNGDIYCVAPIVGPAQNTTKGGNASNTLDHYDFWAVGLNCCSGHVADFHCGEYTNPNAHKGLRLMRDDLRGYFRLAVEEAIAVYHIQAPHPVFMYWMEMPSDEIQAYLDDGWKSLLHGILGFFAVQVALTAVAVIFFL